MASMAGRAGRATSTGSEPGWPSSDIDVMVAMQPVPRARSTPSTSTPSPRTGSRAWSRPTSATASPPTSTGRSPRSWTPIPGPWSTRCWPTRDTPTSSWQQVRAGDRGRPEAGRPAGAVGPAARRRGAQPGPAGGGGPGRADQPADRHGRPARAWTWPRSAGCSPGWWPTTPSGWPSSVFRPDLGGRPPGARHRLAGAEADPPGVLLAEVDVADLGGGDQHLAATLVGQR